MKVVLIGAGNLATNLGKALKHAGHDILMVYSRTDKSASTLAEILGCGFTSSITEITNEADMYVVSVKDNILTELVEKVCFGRKTKCFVHTAGSMPINIFEGLTNNYGVLYPMQSFSKDKEADFNEIPIFVEANNEVTQSRLDALCNSLSKRIYHLNTEDRKYLHLSAVFACNFVNHCYDISSEILKHHGLPFDIMLPLIDETATKIHTMSPRASQTGPAVRYDVNVIEKQMQLLDDYPRLKEIYNNISLNIHDFANEKNKIQ